MPPVRGVRPDTGTDMLAAIAGVLFVVSAVLEWVGKGNALAIAFVAGAFLSFHFVFSYYVTTYRR